MRNGPLSITSALVASALISLPSFSCTDFQVKTTDDKVIIGRSMEWGADLKSRLVVHPKNETCKSKAPGGKRWTVMEFEIWLRGG